MTDTQRIYDASDNARVREVGAPLLGALKRFAREAQDAVTRGHAEAALVLRLEARDMDRRFAAHLRGVAAQES